MPKATKQRQLSEEEIADLREAFAIFDTNRDGTIEAKELKEVMRSLGQSPSSSEIRDMIKSVDGDNNGAIDFDEFLILMRSRNKDPDQELRNAFRVFDSDNSGSISREELKQLMINLGQDLSEAEIDAMMEMVDENGDGEISFEEFKNMMNS